VLNILYIVIYENLKKESNSSNIINVHCANKPQVKIFMKKKFTYIYRLTNYVIIIQKE